MKKNPVERMGFEEFFICSTVVECRKLDQISLNLFSTIDIKNSVQVNTKPTVESKPKTPDFTKFGNSTESSENSYSDHTNQSKDLLEAPFPEYNHDLGWLKKIDEIVVPSIQQQQLNTPSQAPSQASDKLSFHSSLASELSNLNNNTMESKSSEDDFIVVERENAHVNWHQSLANTVQGLVVEKKMESPVIQSKELGTTPVATMFTMPKTSASSLDEG